MNIKRQIIPIIALFGLILCSAPAMADDAEIIEKLKKDLENTKSAEDSLPILFDLFDISANKDKVSPGEMILDIAGRTNRDDLLEEFIPQLSSLYKGDESKLKAMLMKANQIEDTDARKGVKLFVNVRRAQFESNYVSDEDFHSKLLEYAKADMKPTGDLYQDILDLWRVLIFVGKSSKSNLYLEYLTRLENLIRQLPPECYYVRNQFLTASANIHTQNGNTEKAIQNEKELLKIIGELEKKYRAEGRKYRDFNQFYYISYRRLLRNYRGLPLNKVLEYRDKCKYYASQDSDVYRDMKLLSRPAIYSLMAEKKYEKVLPLLKNAFNFFDTTNNKSMQREMLRMLVEAADSVGDEKTLLFALRENNKELQQVIDRKTEEAYRELHIRYDIENLKKENTLLEVEKRDLELATSEKLIAVALTALLALAVLLMFLFRRHFLMAQQNRDLKMENDQLHIQIEDFLDNGTPKGTLDVREGRPGARKQNQRQLPNVEVHTADDRQPSEQGTVLPTDTNQQQ